MEAKRQQHSKAFSFSLKTDVSRCERKYKTLTWNSREVLLDVDLKQKFVRK